MGKKKRQRTDAEDELVYAKKHATAYSPDSGLSATCALHLYARKNKFGNPGYRERQKNPYIMTVVLDGADLASAQHADRDTAMEKASLLSLHLMDPEAVSIGTMITSTGLWRHPEQIDPNEAELTRFKDKVGARVPSRAAPSPWPARRVRVLGAAVGRCGKFHAS